MSQLRRLVTPGIFLALMLTGCQSTPQKTASVPPAEPAERTPSVPQPPAAQTPAPEPPLVKPGPVISSRAPAPQSVDRAAAPVKTAPVKPAPAKPAPAKPAPDRSAPVRAAKVPSTPVSPVDKTPARSAPAVAPSPPPTVAKVAPETRKTVDAVAQPPAAQSTKSADADAPVEPAITVKSTAAVSDATVSDGSEKMPAAPAATPDTTLAMLTPPREPARDEPDFSAMKFDLEHLPMKLAGGWRIDRRNDRVEGKERCMLYSPKVPVFDGYESSALQLEVSMQNIVVRADSNIDTTYPDQGLRVDSGTLVPFEAKLLNDRTVYTNKPVQVAMANGNKLKIGLGFWPTWPVTQTQYASFDLGSFRGAYRALQACTQQQSAR